MKKRPLIGIPCREAATTDWTPKIHGVLVPYLQALHEARALPLLIPLIYSQDSIQQYYSMIDGLLLAGGFDLGSDTYNQKPHPNLRTTNPEQDFLEIQLINKAFRDKKPILAICRGIQILNVALGGSLIQHLEDGSSCNLNHDLEGKAEVWTEDAHKLLLNKESRLSHLLGENEISVNSLHHQALDVVSDKLKITGNSDDGVIEAIEANDPNHFCIGVQCHPEMLFSQKDTRWKRVFSDFTHHCTK